MATAIPVARTTLSYPLYTCAFDSQDASKLFVGGGGGAGRNGVGNKITILSTAQSNELNELAEAELSREEDNVTTLAIGQRKGKSTLLYAGINSSPEDIAKGKNEHLRTFKIDSPATSAKSKSPASLKITEAAKTSLFDSHSKDTYQRVLRLSAPQGNKPQVGAVATGLAGKDSEVVLFEVGSGTTAPKILGRIELNKEAVDVDVFQTGKDEYLMVYCTDLDIWAQKVTSKGAEAPVAVYDMPGQHPTEKPTIPAFRAVRIIAEDFLVLLTNIHGRSGAVVQILRLDGITEGCGRLAGSIRMPSTIKQGTGLAVANLNPPTTPGPQDTTQYAIAVTAQDNSVWLLSTDLKIVATIRQITIPKIVRSFTDVHALQITGLSFSPIQASAEGSETASIKLATVSVGNTVAVHTLPLATKRVAGADTPQYQFAINNLPGFKINTPLVTIIVLILALLAQSTLEVTGHIKPILGARNHVPESWLYPTPLPPPPRHRSHPVIPVPPVHAHPNDVNLKSAISSLQVDNPDQIVILQDHAAAVDALPTIEPAIHDPAVHGTEHKTWEQLDEKTQKDWLKRLQDAGHYTEDFAETVLKSVVFGEIAGAVGRAVAG